MEHEGKSLLIRQFDYAEQSGNTEKILVFQANLLHKKACLFVKLFSHAEQVSCFIEKSVLYWQAESSLRLNDCQQKESKHGI